MISDTRRHTRVLGLDEQGSVWELVLKQKEGTKCKTCDGTGFIPMNPTLSSKIACELCGATGVHTFEDWRLVCSF